MSTYCPKCQQRFREPGFCPYDGTALQPGKPGSEYEKLIGTTLDGRYYIERKLGEGGMGVVFAARHTIIEKPVAVKVLKREVARDQSVVKRFVQEAKAASRIGHPSIVDVTDFGTTPDGMTYSVMEFVEGRTLSQVLREDGRMGLSRALPIIAQLAKALGAAHDKGIVHRDLKPENVFLVDREGRSDFVKIVDFGIAKVTEEGGDGARLTQAGTVFGTPEYMAPEQAAGRNDTDRRVDIYALGTILYEMLVGKVPHKGESMVRTLAMQMLDPITPPRQADPTLDISDELEAVMMTALAKKRESRFDTMNELLVAIESVAGGIPLVTPESPSAPHDLLLAADADARTLVPRPPGADIDAASPAVPRRKRPTTKNDPAFLNRKRPLSFDHVYQEESQVDRGREPSARWPIALAIIVVLTGAGIAIALMVRGKGGESEEQVATAPIDAGAKVAIDAAMAAAAAAPAPPDASAPAAELHADARRAIRKLPAVRLKPGPKPKPKPKPPVVGRTLTVKVIPNPSRATLYVGSTYRGTGTTNFQGKEGEKLTVSCRMPGYKSGRVRIAFDGVNDVYLCRMTRIKKCVEGIKNPFDDCPD